jgi:hypothetical protein
MTTYRITLRCLPNAEGSWDHSSGVERIYRVEAWTREDAISHARMKALAAGFRRTVVVGVMPAFMEELPR